MLDLTQWILDLESGTSDLKTCLSEYPDLEPSERFALALAEQKYRRINGLSCDLRHYLEILPELVDSPSRVLELILAQLGPELDTASLSKLERQIEDQIAQLSAEQQSPLRKNLATWNSQALDSERIESLWWEFEDQYKLGIIPRIEHWILKSPASVRSDLLTGFLLSDAYQQQRRNGTIDWPAYIE
jgi:uncharacterized protein (DUF58 family)